MQHNRSIPTGSHSAARLSAFAANAAPRNDTPQLVLIDRLTLHLPAVVLVPAMEPGRRRRPTAGLAADGDHRRRAMTTSSNGRWAATAAAVLAGVLLGFGAVTRAQDVTLAVWSHEAD